MENIGQYPIPQCQYCSNPSAKYYKQAGRRLDSARSPRPPRSEIAIFQRFSVLVRFVICGGSGSELIFVAVMADPSRLTALHNALAFDAQLLAVL